MDVVSAVSGYVSKMVLAGDTSLGSSSSKMKMLLLDSETVRVYVKAHKRSLANPKKVSIISTATTQSALLAHEVYLIE
jgi:vacuolar protein sorting-associated protein 45